MKQKKLWTFWFVCLIVLVLVMTLLETLLVGYQQNEWQSRLAKSVVTLESRWNDKEEQRLQLEEVVVTRMVGLANVVASELLYDDQVNLSLLQQQLSVDDINIYSPRGVVLNSSHLPSVGYQVNEEHPVIKLFANEETMYFEPVREHLLKNEAMKFIYLQVGSKYVVQVGVLASQLGVYDFRYVLLEEVMKDQSALSWVWKQKDDECLFSSANLRVNNCTSLNRSREYMMVSLPSTYGGDLWVEFNPKEFQSFFWKIRWIVYGMIGLFYLFYTVYMHMQNKKHNELMGDLYYDAMTRLPNHRYFFDIIKTMWSSDYSLLLLQIGKLNQINVIQGYAIGDDLIHRFVIHMTNNDQVPKPKGEVRIEELTVTPYPDRRRVFIVIKVTPFQERPNLVLVARDEDDNVVSELDIIETMHYSMEFTMHLRGQDDPAGAYSLTADLFYETKSPPQDQHIVGFVIPSAQSDETTD